MDGPWDDWRWQVRSAAGTMEQARRLCPAPGIAGDPAPLEEAARRFPVRATPFYLSLIERWDPSDPIYRQVIPLPEELRVRPDELADPIGDQAEHLPGPVPPGLTHRYPDRVLLHAGPSCAVHCRHCFRRDRPTAALRPGAFPAALDYIAGDGSIREAILTGGDPLMLEDAPLLELLTRLAEIPHLRLLRLHSRMPVVVPGRITPELSEALAGLPRPLRLVTQFNHPRELTPEARRAANRLMDAGVPVLNQSVLLRGVNHQPEIMEELLWGLAEARIQPYYLHQGDKARGTAHLRVPVERGIELIQRLRGRLPGHALPRLMLEIPGGHGKVPVEPSHLRRLGPGVYELTDHRGRRHEYREEPAGPDGDRGCETC